MKLVTGDMLHKAFRSRTSARLLGGGGFGAGDASKGPLRVSSRGMEWLQSVAFGIGQEAKTRTTTTPGGSSSTRHGSPFLQPYQRRQVGATKWDLATVSLPMVPALRYLWYAWWKGPPGHSDSSASKELHSLHLADFMFMPNSDSSLRDNDPATFFADPFKATKATGFILHVLGRFAEEAKIFETDRELLEKALLARPWGRGEEQKTGSQYGAEAKKNKGKAQKPRAKAYEDAGGRERKNGRGEPRLLDASAVRPGSFSGVHNHPWRERQWRRRSGATGDHQG
mmetsp:Transcript_22035/g.55571  ORF Transcript_22035/g.55571 Transcript_22035/m.55571 type:complete len:283 (-) Transcript_22035:352-1200(-)